MTRNAETDQLDNKSDTRNILLTENSQKMFRNGLKRCNDFHVNIVSLKIVQCDTTLTLSMPGESSPKVFLHNSKTPGDIEKKLSDL